MIKPERPIRTSCLLFSVLLVWSVAACGKSDQSAGNADRIAPDSVTAGVAVSSTIQSSRVVSSQIASSEAVSSRRVALGVGEERVTKSLTAGSAATSGGGRADSSDRAIFEQLLKMASEANLAAEPYGTIVQTIGMEFLGAEYVAGLLDESDREQLVVSFSKFDCVLFVETVLAVSRSIAANQTTFESFTAELQALRYRGGMIDGYCSRLHYFSDWIDDNEERGNVKNLTEQLGGLRVDESPDFMSSNRSLYPRFADNDSLFAGIRKMEDDLTRVAIFTIPQSQIKASYPGLKAGDIIATSTSVNGLDVSHTGFAFDNGDGSFGFLHASTSGGVKVSPDLSDYIHGNRKQTGIVVIRPLDGRNLDE